MYADGTTYDQPSKLAAQAEKRVSAAVARLNGILPLKARQEKLSEPLRRLHRDILNAYVEIGRTLSRDEIGGRMENAADAIQTLAENDLIVVDSEGELVGAYPFTMEQREHKLKVNGHQVHCMCALDALAVNPMFGAEVEITSRCRVSDQPVRLRQKRYRFHDADDTQDLFFGISWNAASASSCCANSLCTEMIFLKGDLVAKNWRDQDAENREIFTLDEAILFATDFFLPLLED